MGRLAMIKYVMVLGGIILLFNGIGLFKDSKTTPINYNEATYSDINKGVIIEGDIEMTLGKFEENYSTNYGIKNSSSVKYKYAIPIEDKFMGYSARVGVEDTRLEKLTDETYEYLEEERNLPPTPYHFVGKVYKLPQDSHGYFKEALLDVGFSTSEAEDMIFDYYIEQLAFDRWPYLLFGGLGLTVLGVIWVIVHKRNTGSFF